MKRKYRKELLNDLYMELNEYEDVDKKEFDIQINDNISGLGLACGAITMSLDISFIVSKIVDWVFDNIDVVANYISKPERNKRHYRNLVLKYKDKIAEIKNRNSFFVI